MYIGLDISSACTGVAVVDADGGLIYHDALHLKKCATFEEKFKTLHDNLVYLIKLYDVKHIVIEDQFMGVNAKTYKVLTRLSGIAFLNAALHDISITAYTPKFIKSAFTGNGKASKDEIADQVENKFGLVIKNDNITDAIAIAFVGYEERRKMENDIT